ncbi:MAG: helix-turn-helix domain-containing protein [Hydrogenophaga sp.]|jgi:AraC-like DNA-binding protein|nr:helix-turn-helix domain-containing protein [Hydrogenophaga sp.]
MLDVHATAHDPAEAAQKALTERLAKLTARALATPASAVDEIAALADEAQAQGWAALQVEALRRAAGLASMGADLDLARAAALLAQGLRSARRHRLDSAAAILQAEQARCLRLGGDMAAAATQLAALVDGPDWDRLSPGARALAMQELACTFHAAGLAALGDKAFEQAAATAAEVPGGLWSILALQHLSLLDAYARTLPLMADALTGPAPEQELAAPDLLCRMQRLEQQLLHAAQRCDPGSFLRQQAQARVDACPLMRQALQGDATAVAQTMVLARPLDSQPRNWWTMARHAVIGLLSVGRAVEALQLIEQGRRLGRRLAPGSALLQDREQLLYLKFKALQQLGDAARALTAYKTYARLAAARAAQVPTQRLAVPQRMREPPDAAPIPSLSVGLQPPYLRKAVALLSAQPAHPWSVASLAKAVGVTDRCLRMAFTAHLGLGPAAYILRERLDALRAALLDARRARQPASVQAHAQTLGLRNDSRMVAQYRQRFGERPADTLRG